MKKWRLILTAILAMVGYIVIPEGPADALSSPWPRPGCSFNDTSVTATAYNLPSVIVTVEDYLGNVLAPQDKARTVYRYQNNGFYIWHTKTTPYDYWGIGWGENYAYNLDNARGDVSGTVTDC